MATCRVCYGDRESVDGVIGRRASDEPGAKSAAKIGRRELAIRIRGVRAFVAGETPGGHEWNQQNLENGFLDATRSRLRLTYPVDGRDMLRRATHSNRLVVRVRTMLSNTQENNYDRRLPFFEPWRRDPPPEEAAVHGTGTKSKALSGTEYA